MENGFELLEEKVRKAAELVKRLRKENKALEEQLAGRRGRALSRSCDEAARRPRSARADLAGRRPEAGSARAARSRTCASEREEIRSRIARLVEVLDTLD